MDASSIEDAQYVQYTVLVHRASMYSYPYIYCTVNSYQYLVAVGHAEELGRSLDELGTESGADVLSAGRHLANHPLFI